MNTLDTTLREVQNLISNAQDIIVNKPNDPNAALIELSCAYGMLELILNP